MDPPKSGSIAELACVNPCLYRWFAAWFLICHRKLLPHSELDGLRIGAENRNRPAIWNAELSSGRQQWIKMKIAADFIWTAPTTLPARPCWDEVGPDQPWTQDHNNTTDSVKPPAATSDSGATGAKAPSRRRPARVPAGRGESADYLDSARRTQTPSLIPSATLWLQSHCHGQPGRPVNVRPAGRRTWALHRTELLRVMRPAI